MINKNDYGSYEAPEAILFSVVTEAYCNTGSPYTSGGAGTYGDDDTNENGDY